MSAEVAAATVTVAGAEYASNLVFDNLRICLDKPFEGNQ